MRVGNLWVFSWQIFLDETAVQWSDVFFIVAFFYLCVFLYLRFFINMTFLSDIFLGITSGTQQIQQEFTNYLCIPINSMEK